MNRLKSLLAVGALALAGALGATAAQASATNVNVNFVVHNADLSASMIRAGSLPTGITGPGDPASAIGPGGYDPSSGNALFSVPAPSIGNFVSASLKYWNASDLSSNPCTFGIKVTRLASTSYKLHVTIGELSTNCSVPGDVTNSDGQFTSTNYVLTWHT